MIFILKQQSITEFKFFKERINIFEVREGNKDILLVVRDACVENLNEGRLEQDLLSFYNGKPTKTFMFEPEAHKEVSDFLRG
jgi:hypothetical protein